MSWLRALPLLVLLGALAAWGAGVPPPGRWADPVLGPGVRVDARVLDVIDGDTLAVQVAGRRETLRYIGLDTPETVKPHAPVECFGPTASRAHHRLVDGAELALELGREPRDRYGRLLADVRRRRDGLWVNGALVGRGLATVLTIAPNDARADELARLQGRARRARRGLWGACRGAG